METLLIGVVQTLVPNTIYALPDRRCLLFCDDDKAALQQSTDAAFTLDTHIPLVDGMCEVTGGFIRNVGQANVLAVVKC